MTNIDMLECLTKCPANLPMNVSDDPGKYLCGYIYYKSLEKMKNLNQEGHHCTTLFIHVPLVEVISSDEIATCLMAVCKYLLEK